MNKIDRKFWRTVKQGNFLSIDHLIACGADCNVRDESGWTPLMEAVYQGRLPLVQILVNHMAEIDAQSSDGNTALMIACITGYTDVVQYLTSVGANIGLRCQRGNTALHYAILYRRFDIVLHLLDLGADPNCQNEEKDTPLLIAAKNRECLDNITLLIERGANVNMVDASGSTALFYLAYKGDTEVVVYLLKQGADVTLKNNRGTMPLEIIQKFRPDISIF